MIEHRYGKRHKLLKSIPVSLFQQKNFAATGRIRDIGLHGLFIETQIRFDKNTFLKIRFTLPNPKGKSVTYQTWGLVTHRQRDGIGLHLDILNPDNLAGLRAITDQVSNCQPPESRWEPSYSETG